MITVKEHVFVMLIGLNNHLMDLVTVLPFHVCLKTINHVPDMELAIVDDALVSLDGQVQIAVALPNLV